MSDFLKKGKGKKKRKSIYTRGQIIHEKQIPTFFLPKKIIIVIMIEEESWCRVAPREAARMSGDPAKMLEVQ